jgi:hypothetical protein
VVVSHPPRRRIRDPRWSTAGIVTALDIAAAGQQVNQAAVYERSYENSDGNAVESAGVAGIYSDHGIPVKQRQREQAECDA